LRESAREFGRLKVLLLWLHAFEEPFYSREQFRALAHEAPFGEGQIRFVGAMCCLALEKKEAVATAGHRGAVPILAGVGASGHRSER